MSQSPSLNAVLAWTRLVRAQQIVLEAVEADLKAAGFPPLAWYDILLELRREAAGLRPVELESRLLLRQHNVSRLIDRLEAAGHAARRPCPGDGRGQIIEITASGRDLLARMWPRYAAAIQTHLGSRLDDGQADVLAALLGRLTG